MPSPAREPCPSPVAYRHAFASRKAARRRPLSHRRPVESSKLFAYLAKKIAASTSRIAMVANLALHLYLR